LPAELSDAELEEYDLLRIPEAEWQKIVMMLTPEGRPLVDRDENGTLVFNDPQLAEWDRKARANAEALDKQRGM